MELELYKLDAEDRMNDAAKSYEVNITKISTGRANPAILNNIKIIYYDSPTPIHELSNVLMPEPRQLLIKPFDVTINKEIAKVINNSNLGVQAIDEGDKVRMTFPELSTERRRELVKSLSQYTEQAKVKIRGVRQDINKHIKADDELNEDDVKWYLDSIQELTNKYTSKIDALTKDKEKDLMTI